MSPQTKQNIARFLAFAIIPLSGFATDIYIPSLPQMGADLNVTSLQVQMTLTIFLISYGLSQLFIGAILDSFGRFKIGLAALVLFAISCVVVATTQNIYVIFLMRAIHGLTVATIVVAKRAYFVDLYEGEQLRNYLSIFTIIWSAGPIIAPFIGGFLQTGFGWNFNFYFLAAIAGALAILEYIFSGETLPVAAEFNLRKIAGVYYRMLTTASFTLGLIMLGLAYSMVMVYNLTGPFIIEHHFNFSPVIIGYCSLILGFAWMLGGLLGKLTINRPFLKKIIINLIIQLLFVVIMLVSITFVETVYSLIFFAFIVHVCAGYTFNNYFTFNLGQFPQNAGIAGGLVGGVVFVIVSFLSYMMVYFIPAKDERNLSISYLFLVLASFVIMLFVYKFNNSRKFEK
ncbi:MFS transporter [Flavobacterium terrisoli]|uniref:MFS transporter n=1 Tax=Flavobacterium terrisoli TaxID=3242195 RepID=UPI002542E8EB|nr:MFS transporter [Flavobacterium buctense]